MNNQICTACGNQNSSGTNEPLSFCTNCGSKLVNRVYSPNYQTQPMYPAPRPKTSLNKKEKFGFAALVAIPILIILSVIGAVIWFAVFVANHPPPSSYQTPRTYPSPTKKNAVLTFGDDGLVQGKFKEAASIAVDKDGNIYVGDGTLRIQKFNSKGEFLQFWNVTESTAKTNDKYTNKIEHLAIDRKNTLYAVLPGGEVLRYDGATGKFIDKITLYGDKFVGQKQVVQVTDVFMQADDKLALLVTSFPDNEYVLTISPDGKVETRLKNPLRQQIKSSMIIYKGNLVVSPAGDYDILYSASLTDKAYLYRYKSDGTFIDKVTWEGSNYGPLFNVKRIGLGNDGLLYAYNKLKQRVDILSVEGILKKSILIDDFSFEKMVVDANNNVFILTGKGVSKYSAVPTS